MARCLYFAPLGARDARKVARLERRLHRAHNVHGAEALHEELAAIADENNLSFGLWDGGRLVGYVIAYFEGQGCEDGAGDAAVYVSDFAISPRYRSLLPEVTGRLFDRVRQVGLDCPVEAHSFAPELEKWTTKLAPLIADQGFRVVDYRKVDDEDGIDRFWVRFEPHPDPSSDPHSMAPVLSHEVDGTTYAVRILRSEFHWARLEPFWDSLLRRTPDATGFQSFAYMRAWWRCFGMERRRLVLLTFWASDELRGIAPLAIQARRTPLGWMRELTFLGTQSEVDRPTFLFGSDIERCTRVLLHTLASHAVEWDWLALYEQRTDARAFPLLRERGSRRPYRWATTEDTTSAYIRLNGTFEDFLASRSRHFRKRIRSAVRKLERQGELRFERCTDWPEVVRGLARHRELERRSWKHGTEAGLGEKRRSAFYDELVRALGPKGKLHVISLRIDDRLIASTLAMVHDAHYYSLQIVHDAAYNKFSPGTALEYFEIRDCFESPYEEYDFLGGHLNNKQRWTSALRETVEVHLVKRSFLTTCRFLWMFRVGPRLHALLVRTRLSKRARALRARLRRWVETVRRIGSSSP